MKKYGIVNIGYAYIVRFVEVILLAIFISTIGIFILNLLPSDLSSLRHWVEKNYIYIIIVAALGSIVYWRRLLPTLRTLMTARRNDDKGVELGYFASSDKGSVLLVTAIFLLTVALLPKVGVWSEIATHSVRYIYVGIFLALLALLAWVAGLMKPQLPNIETGLFVPDQPEDGLTVTETQQQAIDYLTEIMIYGAPRSVALTGDWGSGKTLVYRYARSAATSARKEIVWVDFNPWQYASEEALVKGFYESIAKTLDSEVPGMQNMLTKITKSVEQLVSKTDGGGILQVLGNTLQDLSSQTNTPDEIIKGLLSREGKRLIIAMDDVERQYDTERTFRALQLVHHAKSMGAKNVQVLCIFERTTLLNAAPAHVPSGQEYLEKFSEIEITLPPPTLSSLREQLERLLNTQSYKEVLPSNFKLELNNSSVKDMKSHRSIIRAFNKLLLEFHSAADRKRRLTQHESTTSEELITYVNYTDRFLMGHIELKYPIVFRDIADNRGIYTTMKEDEEDVWLQFMDDKDIKEKYIKHFDTLFAKGNISGDQLETLKNMLVDLFPKTGEILNDRHVYIDSVALRNERRVGHRDVLDAYFALTASQDAYNEHMLWIGDVVKDIAKASDKEMIDRFIRYMQLSSQDESDVDGFTLLRNELLHRKYSTNQLKAFRAWLRAVLVIDYRDRNYDDDFKNRALGRVLSALNDVALRSPEEERIEMGVYIFNRITVYLKTPYDALLLVLFLLPERNNLYVHDYITSKGFGKKGLFIKLLKWVDAYFASTQINIYKEYPSKVWRFISHQWAFSGSTMNYSLNTNIPDARERYENVTKYLMHNLNEDDLVALNFLYEKFLFNEGIERDDDSSEQWTVNKDELAPYKVSELLILANKLRKSSSLTPKQRRHVMSFIHELEEYAKPLDGDFVSYGPR